MKHVVRIKNNLAETVTRRPFTKAPKKKWVGQKTWPLEGPSQFLLCTYVKFLKVFFSEISGQFWQ